MEIPDAMTRADGASQRRDVTRNWREGMTQCGAEQMDVRPASQTPIGHFHAFFGAATARMSCQGNGM